MTWREDFEKMARRHELAREYMGDLPVGEIENAALRLFAEALVARFIADREAWHEEYAGTRTPPFKGSDAERQSMERIDRLWAEAKAKAGA